MSRHTWLGAMAAVAVIHSTASAQRQTISDREIIQTRIVTMLHAIDVLDWIAVRASFTPRVRIDYTALFGGNAETIPVDTLMARWQGLVPGFDATQHLIGPVILRRADARTASAETQVRGYHYIADAEGGPVWMVAGRYQFAVEKHANDWLIAGITLHVAYQEGNLNLPSVAQGRKGKRAGTAAARP